MLERSSTSETLLRIERNRKSLPTTLLCIEADAILLFPLPNSAGQLGPSGYSATLPDFLFFPMTATAGGLNEITART
jgi:hypothetical protein